MPWKDETSPRLTARLTPKHRSPAGTVATTAALGREMSPGVRRTASYVTADNLPSCNRSDAKWRWVKASDGQPERGTWWQLAGDTGFHQPQLWKRLREHGRAGGAGRLQMPQRCPRGPETHTRQGRWGSISPEHCSTTPCTILETGTKTDAGQLHYSCLVSTHASCFAWWGLTNPAHAPHWGFWAHWEAVSHCWAAAVPSHATGAPPCPSSAAAGERLCVRLLVGPQATGGWTTPVTQHQGEGEEQRSQGLRANDQQSGPFQQNAPKTHAVPCWEGEGQDTLAGQGSAWSAVPRARPTPAPCHHVWMGK